MRITPTHKLLPRGRNRGALVLEVETQEDPRLVIADIVSYRGPNTSLVSFVGQHSGSGPYLDNIAIALSEDPRTEDLTVWEDASVYSIDWPSINTILLTCDATALLRERPELDVLQNRILMELPLLPSMDELRVRLPDDISWLSSKHLDLVATELNPVVSYVEHSSDQDKLISLLKRCTTHWMLDNGKY